MAVRINHQEEAISRRGRILLTVLLIFVTLIVYGQVYFHDFVNYDDHAYVVDNNSVKTGLTWSSITWAFTTNWASNWHPLTWLSHMMDVQLFGVNPAGHHLTSVFFHILNTLLLLYLLYRTTGSYVKSLFVAALFALHPLHVESVAWIAERKDVLSTFLMLGTMLLYSLHCKRPRPILYVSALATYALGLMAKPMLVSLPFVLLLWDIWPLERVKLQRDMEAKSGSPPFSRLLIEKIPFLALSLVSCIVTIFVQHKAGAVAVTKTMPLSFRAINALISYVAYLWHMIWPVNLAAIYPLPSTLAVSQGVLAAVTLLAITIFAWRLGRLHPYLLVGWCWYIGTLVPVIGLVQVGQQSMADRYTYIPLIGIFFMIIWGTSALKQHLTLQRYFLPAVSGLVLAILTFCCWRQIGYWKNSVMLFEHASSAVSDNHIALRILGNALAQRGDFSNAEHAFHAALQIRPDDDQSYTEWGASLVQQKRYVEAVDRFSAALRINPDSATAHYNLGVVLASLGKVSEAIEQYRVVLRIDPDDKDAQNNLAGLLAETGKIDEAISHYRRALQQDPSNVEICFSLGSALSMQGDITGGIRYFTRALTIRPDFAEAHYNLGIALVKSGKLADAIEHFSAAVRINPSFTEARKSLEKALNMRTAEK